MLVNILTILLIAISVTLLLGYFYIDIWLIPKQEGRRQALSWIAFAFTSLAVFLLTVAWRLHEPLAKDFLPAFVVISLLIGLLFRESAISPYRLANFWRKLQKKDKQ